MKLKYIGLGIIVIIITITLILFLSVKSRSGKKEINHIFLITLDTLRADHLSVYDYPRSTTPFIESLANKGFVFQNCFSNSATTNPAHSSIFTSLYPIQHGVEKNWIKLNDSFVTMAEILKSHKYKTYAFTSSELFKSNNLNQGFDYFNEPENTRKNFKKKYRPAEYTIKEIEKIFSKRSSKERSFIWIHLFDPHRPYYPPSKYLDQIKNLNDKKEIVSFLENKHKIDPKIYKNIIFSKRGKSEFFKNNPDYYKGWSASDIMYDQINLYDSEISYVDDQIKKIYKFFERSGMTKKSLWILTGDHGEGLGNHNWFMHVREIYSESIKIPLIFYFSDSNRAGKIKNYVEHIDILPSILELLDISNPISNSFSKSFATILTGEKKSNNKKFLFAKREIFKKRKWKKKIPVFSNYEHGDKYSIIHENYQFIFRTEGLNELFNIKTDPYETDNILVSSANIGKKLKSILFNILKKSKIKIKTERASSDKINKIKSLGYIE